MTVGAKRLCLMVCLLRMRAGQLGAAGVKGPFCFLLSPSLSCGGGEAWSERKAPSLGIQSESSQQSHCRSNPACLAGRASLHPPPPLTPLRSFGLSRNFTMQIPSDCHRWAETIVIQPSAALGNKSRLRDQAGEGRSGVSFSSFMAVYGKYEVGVGGSLCWSMRGKLFAGGVQKGQSHTTEGRTFRAAPGQNWRMLSPVCTAAEHHSGTKLSVHPTDTPVFLFGKQPEQCLTSKFTFSL